MNAAQVRAKSRRAMKRLEDEYENEEMESGELNLVPYLDIVTNITLFLLASVATGVLGNLNVTPPAIADPSVASTKPPADEDKGLGLFVAITKAGIVVQSIADPPAIDRIDIPLKFNGFDPNVAKSNLGRVKADLQRRINLRTCGAGHADSCAKAVKAPDPDLTDAVTEAFDWDELSKRMKDIRAKNPLHPIVKPDKSEDFGHQREILIWPDGEVPYDVVIRAMDTLRAADFPDVQFSPGITRT